MNRRTASGVDLSAATGEWREQVDLCAFVKACFGRRGLALHSQNHRVIVHQVQHPKHVADAPWHGQVRVQITAGMLRGEARQIPVQPDLDAHQCEAQRSMEALKTFAPWWRWRLPGWPGGAGRWWRCQA